MREFLSAESNRWIIGPQPISVQGSNQRQRWGVLCGMRIGLICNSPYSQLGFPSPTQKTAIVKQAQHPVLAVRTALPPGCDYSRICTVLCGECLHCRQVALQIA